MKMKQKPNHNSWKFVISICLNPENKKLKKQILCFRNETEGSKQK